MKRSIWLAPALIVLLALVLRLAAIALDDGYVPAHDAFDYDRHGRSIAAGEGFPESGYVPDGGPSALRPPVYPYVLGAVYAVTGDSIDAARGLGAVCGAISVFLLYLIVLRVWGRRTALIAALALAIFPPQILLARELLSEALFVALELGALLCVFVFRDFGRRLRWAVAAGVLCGVGALTRNPGGVLIVAVAAGLWGRAPRLAFRAWVGPAVAVACLALTVAPWTLRNWIDFGRLVPVTSSTGFALAGTYNSVSERDPVHPGAWRTPVIVPEYEHLFHTPGIDEATLDQTLRSEAVEFAWDHPGYVARVSGRNLLRLFELSEDSVVGRGSVEVSQRGIGSETSTLGRVSIAIAVLLAVLGVVAIVSAGLPRGPVFLWLVPVLTLLLAAPIAGLPRYRMPADPFILILAAIGLNWAWQMISRRRMAAS